MNMTERHLLKGKGAVTTTKEVELVNRADRRIKWRIAATEAPGLVLNDTCCKPKTAKSSGSLPDWTGVKCSRGQMCCLADGTEIDNDESCKTSASHDALKTDAVGQTNYCLWNAARKDCRVGGTSKATVDYSASMGGTPRLIDADTVKSVTLDVTSLDHQRWGKQGGSWKGEVIFQWWIVDEKNARVSAVFAEASAVEVYVSARVPALILPNQLQEALLLGESTRSEVGPGGASFLSIYAVGESRSSVTWSVRILNHACDDCVSFPNECVRKGSPRQRYVGDESGTSSGCDRVCTLQKRDRATLDSVEWLSLLGVDDLDGVYSGVMTPGTGLASKLKLKYNVSRFHTNYSLDLGDELAGNASCTAASRDPLKKSPELKACIEVNVLEDGGGADGAGTKSDIFRASIPVVLKVALKCPSGQFSENGLTPCYFCPKDQYQDESGATGCKVCSLLPGRQLSTTLNTRGATTSDACVVCPEGAVCRLELPGACPFVDTLDDKLDGGASAKERCLPITKSDNMATADHRAWEFSQKNGDVTVYMTAKNGHKREERCGIEDDMYKGYSRVVFDPCDRASSCLGAADQEGPIRKWTYSSNKLKEWHNLNATEDPEQVFLTPLARQNFSDIRNLPGSSAR